MSGLFIFLTLLLCSSFLLNSCHSIAPAKRTDYRQQSVRMIDDVLRHETLPTSIFWATCWTANENAAIFRTLDYPMTFLDRKSTISVTPDVNRNWVYIVVDLDCGWKEGWLAEVDPYFLEHPIRWLLLTPDSLNTTDHLWKDVSMWVASHVTLGTWNSAQSSFHLEQYYKIHKTLDYAIREPFGTWQNRLDAPFVRFQDDRETRILSRRRRDLRGMNMQASMVILNNASLDHLTDHYDKTVDTITKCNYVLCDAMMDVLNVTHSYKFVDTWGYMDPVTKKLNGMLGDLKDNTSIIAGTCLYPSIDRIEHLEYSSMITNSHIRFLFRAPPLSYVSNIYYLPFHDMVWLCTGALIFIACLSIYFALRSTQPPDELPENQIRGTDIVLLGVGAIAQMGSAVDAKCQSARISTTFFFIFLLFMYTSYTANIVSLLQATTKSIRTIEDLYKSRLDYGVEDRPYTRFYFPRVVGKWRRLIYEEKVEAKGQPSKWTNMTYGVERMRQGLYTFHGELGPTYRLIEQTFYEHEKCGLVEIDFLGLPPPWVTVAKRTPYKEMIRINFFKLREHGLQGREVALMYPKKPICVTGGSSFQSVRLVDCYIVLQVLGAGCIVAIIIFLLELLLHRRAKSLGIICLY